MLPTPASRRPGNPYRVLVCLLYGRFEWLIRDADGVITVGVRELSHALGLRTARLRAAIAYLSEKGYLTRCRWHGTFFVATFADMAAFPRKVMPAPDVLTASIPPTIDIGPDGNDL